MVLLRKTCISFLWKELTHDTWEKTVALLGNFEHSSLQCRIESRVSRSLNDFLQNGSCKNELLMYGNHLFHSAKKWFWISLLNIIICTFQNFRDNEFKCNIQNKKSLNNVPLVQKIRSKPWLKKSSRTSESSQLHISSGILRTRSFCQNGLFWFWLQGTKTNFWSMDSYLQILT